MSYRAILVYVPVGDGKAQVEFAASLAKESKAHLTGLCALHEVVLLKHAPSNPFVRSQPAKVKELVAYEYKRAAQTEKRFSAIAKRAGVPHSFVTGESDAADLIVYASRLQDVSVVEQQSELLLGPVVHLALSGHPALIVPRDWRAPAFGKRVLIAWNGSEQAAAAVRKSLPLLHRAEQVTVLQGTPRSTFPAGMKLPALDVIAYLKQHGIAAISKKLPASEDAGPAILKRAKEGKCDLIVMGAFGRSRFREWVLGGATRHVLEHMPVPVFVTHQ